jgi:hypothetical protein
VSFGLDDPIAQQGRSNPQYEHVVRGVENYRVGSAAVTKREVACRQQGFAAVLAVDARSAGLQVQQEYLLRGPARAKRCG